MDIIESGASTTLDLIKKISGIDYYQTGQKGQQAGIFMRGWFFKSYSCIIKWYCN